MYPIPFENVNASNSKYCQITLTKWDYSEVTKFYPILNILYKSLKSTICTNMVHYFGKEGG